MNYFIKRDLQEYGPYTLAELQRYVASGNVLLTDLCHSEGSAEWLPVSQVIGNIPVPATAPAPTQASIAAAAAARYPAPPNLHWGVVLLLWFVTCTFFGWIWIFVQAAWLKKVQPESKCIYYFGGAVGVFVFLVMSGVAIGANGNTVGGAQAFAGLLILGRLALLVLVIAGSYSMKNSLEEHYNTAEPIGLSLSGVLTFIFAFFSLISVYFQYHFTQINEARRIHGIYA